MGAETKIEWCHHTFNPWIGCTKVHAGCLNCYAEAQNGRWAYNGGTWGKGAPRKVTSDSNWKQPLKWARDAAKAGERRRVFCASLADVLDEEAPTDAQARLWDLIRETSRVAGRHCLASRDGDCLGKECPQLRDGEPKRSGRHCPLDSACEEDDGETILHPVFGLDWLLLTKRPERWALIPEDVRPLVWLGTSISDQQTADEWVPRLLKAEGFAVRFLSIEPQVGPIDLFRFEVAAVDWIIVGGESGPSARPFNVEWACHAVRYGAQIGTPVFVKQLGGVPFESGFATRDIGGGDLRIQPARRDLDLKDRKGGDWSEWPADLRVREFPEARR